MARKNSRPEGATRTAPRKGRESAQSVAPMERDGNPTHQDIAQLAYAYWEARGYTGGSPEEDWLQAENELKSRRAAAG